MKFKFGTLEPKRLPKTLSGLLTAALDDLQLMERRKNIRIDMRVWLEPEIESGTCGACLAGSLLLGTGRCKLQAVWEDSHAIYTNLPASVQAKMRCVNALRVGDLDDATDNLPHPFKAKAKLAAAGIDNVEVPDYHNDPVGMKRVLRKLAADLRKAEV